MVGLSEFIKEEFDEETQQEFRRIMDCKMKSAQCITRWDELLIYEGDKDLVKCMIEKKETKFILIAAKKVERCGFDLRVKHVAISFFETAQDALWIKPINNSTDSEEIEIIVVAISGEEHDNLSR